MSSTCIRPARLLPGALLALFLAACTPATAPEASSPAAASLAAPASGDAPAASRDPTANCPDADFEAFLDRFANSADVQRTSTMDPLTMESIDADAQPEPAPVSRQVPLSEVDFPVMASTAEQEAQGLERLVGASDAAAREVTVRVPDSGVQMRYLFEAKPCWTLVRISDDTF